MVVVTKENFDREVMSTSKLVIIDFYSDSCGPCKMLAPSIAQLSAEYGDLLKIVKVNAPHEEALARAFQVMTVPTILFIKNGRVYDGVTGYRGIDELRDKIEQYLWL